MSIHTKGGIGWRDYLELSATHRAVLAAELNRYIDEQNAKLK